jgi:hypothetical protein
MTVAGQASYDRAVAAVRDALRRAAVGLALLAGVLLPAPARAASSSFALGEQAVLQVYAGNLSTVTIRGWDRPNVQLDTDDETVQVVRRPVVFGSAQNPLSVSIPLATVAVHDPLGGAIIGSTTLPPEDFPYASDFRAGTHDTVRIVAAPRSHLTVMVPATVAILEARILRGGGNVSVDDYHGGTLFVVSGGGRTALTDDTSAAFLQSLNGHVSIVDSSFDRIRARGNTATFAFERTRARQIEVTTISGSIVFDDGTFDPGLARFESTYGQIAIGVAGGAQVEARSSDGRVYDLWDRRTPTDQRSDSEASATIAGGGPVVNAVTGHGNVFLYDGSLDTRRVLPPEWRQIRQKLRQPGLRVAPGGAAPPQPVINAPNAFRRFNALRDRPP